MEELERLQNKPVPDHSTAYQIIRVAHACSGKKLNGLSCSRVKEPFITTSHSKYHLHLSYNDIAEWARQIVELETTIKKPPYELRGFRTPSPEPVLQHKKHKRSTLEVQEPTQRSKPIHPPLKHSCSQTTLKSTIDLTETPSLSIKKHTRLESSARSPAVAARPLRSTKHSNSTPIPPFLPLLPLLLLLPPLLPLYYSFPHPHHLFLLFVILLQLRLLIDTFFGCNKNTLKRLPHLIEFWQF